MGRRNEGKSNVSHFLKCDACGHIETVPDGITEAHIGWPCVKCDANLLTERDYRLFVAVCAIMPAPPDYVPPVPSPDETIVSSTLYVHDGEITIRIREESAT